MRTAYPAAKHNHIWDVIRENSLKTNTDYSAYNFRNKKKEDEYNESGKLANGTPSIYNEKAVNFIINVLRSSV